MKKVIIADNLSFTYQGAEAPALKNVSFSVNEGECVLLCGRSGCGKTTLTRMFNGLIPEYFKGRLQGHCEVFGLDCGRDPIEKYVPLVGSVFQNPKTQYFNTDTTAELAFPCENMGIPSPEIRARIDACAGQFHLKNLLDHSILKLSGGEKQKVAFAAATMLSPRLMVLDEPTSNLDQNTILELHDMLIQLKQAGVTIILAEHRLAWAMDFVDTYLFFEDGELKNRYDASEFAALPDSELMKKGLRTNDLSVYRRQVEEKEQRKTPAEPFVRTRNVTVGYHRRQPVYRIDGLDLGKGEIIGLMGHNGIGKSTVTRTLCGLLKPLEGEIFLNGRKASKKALLGESFLVMQDVNYQLFCDSVREEVMLDTEDTKKCDEILERLGLLQYANRHPMSLSGGQKQRVAIASAMVSDRQLIFMDEPTSGLDRYHMQQVGELLQQLKAQDKTVLVITHDEELAAGWCDRICALRDDGERKEL